MTQQREDGLLPQCPTCGGSGTLSRHPDERTTDTAPAPVTEEQIKHMVNRFLTWRLPENFNPDGGISFKRYFNENTDHPMRSEPVGTNLLDAAQAEEMVRYMVDQIPITPAVPAPELTQVVAGTDEHPAIYKTRSGKLGRLFEAKFSQVLVKIGELERAQERLDWLVANQYFVGHSNEGYWVQSQYCADYLQDGIYPTAGEAIDVARAQANKSGAVGQEGK